MSLKWFALLLMVLALLAEAGVVVWRATMPAPSTAPIFSFPPAAERFGEPGEFAEAMAVYHADRGARVDMTSGDGTRVTVIDLEWDHATAAPSMAIGGHAPEECNVAAGFTLLGMDAPRTWQVPGQPPMVFDTTRFTDPAGREVVVFKIAWLQGYGTWDLRATGQDRLARLRRSFLRHRGAARVLQAGVFDARDADHAWQVFETEVLEKLVWR